MATVKSVQGNPDPLAPFSAKLRDEYGIQVASVICQEWFNGKMITTTSRCNYVDRMNYVVDKRLFVRGEQDLKYFKDRFGDNGLEFMNIDFRIINIGEKFSRNIANSISEDNYRLDVRASDQITTKIKRDKEDNYRKMMLAKPMLEKAAQMGLPTPMPTDYIPEDEEEMQLYMEIKDRPKIEIAEELLIDYIKKTNDYEQIEKQVNKDIVDLGLFGVQIFTDKNDGVKIRYVDPEFYVHSYVERNDFSDKWYEGYLDTITLSDLQREGDFSEAQIRYIAKSSNVMNSLLFNYYNCAYDEIIDKKVQVLRFAFKTVKCLKYKVKLRAGQPVKVSRKSDDYAPSGRADEKMVERKLDTWIEGNFVIGASAIYGYKECENLSRDVMNKAMSPFVFAATDIYKNIPRSFLSNMEECVNQMQTIHLKIQQLTMELRPDAMEIDLDTLAELDSGTGGAKEAVWKTALKLLQVKGVIFKKRINMGDEGGIKDTAAARPSAQQQGSGLGAALNSWAHYYNLLRELTGVNPAKDGTQSQKALVGTSELQTLAANTNVKHLVDAARLFNQKVCEVITTRIATIYKEDDAKHIQEIYTNVIGKQLYDAIDVMKDRHLHEFGFVFDYLPTNDMMKEFKEDLQLGVQEGTVTPEVKIQATLIARTNIKLALQYLMYNRRRTIKQRQQEQMAMNQNKSENDIRAAQATAQARMQEYQFQKMTDVQAYQKMSEIDLITADGLNQLNAPKENAEFQRDVYLERLKTAADWQMKDFLESRKDKRTELQATQQSRILQQRDTNGNPIDFNAENFQLSPQLEN